MTFGKVTKHVPFLYISSRSMHASNNKMDIDNISEISLCHMSPGDLEEVQYIIYNCLHISHSCVCVWA